MKAITLWQPRASLLACGAKQYETRSWATSYRGPIAIHAASKSYSLADIDFGMIRGFQDTAERIFGCLDANDLPLGAVIATADLAGCWEMHCDYTGEADPRPYILPYANFYRKHIDGNELLFGDWTPGRYAWEFANMKMLDKPIPAKGAQRIWNWEPPDTQEGANQ